MSNAILTKWVLPLSQSPRVTLFLENAAGCVRWTNARGNGSEYASTLMSPFDEHGVLQPHRLAAMVHVAAAMAAAVAFDKSPTSAMAARELATANLERFAAGSTVATAGWAFEPGIAHYFELGATASESQQADERRAVRRLVEYLRRECHIQLWSQLDWPLVQKALKAWAKEAHVLLQQSKTTNAAESRKAGPALKKNAARTGLPDLRTAVRGTNVLVRIAEWLGEHAATSGAVRPKVQNSRKAVEQIWQTQFKRKAPPAQPRHTPEEYAKVVQAILDPSFPMDPRLRLALLMNMERRAGQVLFVSRSEVSVKQGIPFSFQIPAKGNKRTPDLCRFDDRTAAALAEAMESGYLAEFEAAYLAKRITDYWIFPTGQLPKGRSKFSVKKIEGAPWNERSLYDEFKNLERCCGIESVEGRALYGLKRAATDISDAIEGDEELKNAFFSHATSKMREAYMQIAPRQLRQAEQHLALQHQMRVVALEVAKPEAADFSTEPMIVE